MKKAGALLLAAALLLTLCACGRRLHSVPGLGRFDGGQVSVYGGEWQPIEAVYGSGNYLELNADGAGVLCVDGEATAVEWSEEGGALTLRMGTERCTGTVDDGVVTLRFFDSDIRMTFTRAGTIPAALPEPAGEADETQEPDYADYWAGNWYGWHVITGASEELQYLKDTAWDACARITVRGTTGRIAVWDTENEPDELLCEANVAFAPGTTDAGSMTAESGEYLGCDMTDGWTCDPGASDVRQFAHMICIAGRAEDGEGGWVRYRIYLRPWGTDWEDVRTGDTSGCIYRSMLPPGYDDWYAPLLMQGTTEMPDSFEPEE